MILRRVPWSWTSTTLFIFARQRTQSVGELAQEHGKTDACAAVLATSPSGTKSSRTRTLDREGRDHRADDHRHGQVRSATEDANPRPVIG